MTERIACIGGGNMGRAILGGLVRRGHAPAAISVAEPLEASRLALAAEFGVQVTADNNAAVELADVVLLAVKPQQMKGVVQGLAASLRARPPLVLSIAAGITTHSLQQWIGAELPLVRAMPNTPALIGRGATGLYATPTTGAPARELAESLLCAIGIVEWVTDEAHLDAVTALSGSGPAYFFLFLECLESAGVALGLSAATARRLALETAAGAAELARNSALDPAALRVQVTSPGGTTEQALKVFQDGGFNALVAAALGAAANRARELSHEFGDA
jgi:pyrroline-5-carboxylate reductase